MIRIDLLSPHPSPLEGEREREVCVPRKEGRGETAGMDEEEYCNRNFIFMRRKIFDKRAVIWYYYLIKSAIMLYGGAPEGVLETMTRRASRSTTGRKNRRTKRTLTATDKQQRIKRWAEQVGLDAAAADRLIEKYGLDDAYKLALDAMMKPVELAQKEGIASRTSKGVFAALANGEAKAGERAPQQAVKPLPATTPRTVQPSRTISANEAAPLNPMRIKNADVAANRGLHHQYIGEKFPKLNESDFASHDAYVEALRKQYTEMRQYEWELTCQQETLDMYNLSKSPNFIPNKHVWDPKIPEALVKPLAAQDSTYKDQGYIPTKAILDDGNSYASCAGTATRVNDAICQRFGYTGKDRFYLDCNLCSDAKLMHNNPATKKYRHQNRSLKAMIDAGQVGPGTILSIPTGNSGSGYHALTVAQVIRDKNGKITDVVLQANNSTTLTKYSVKNIDASLHKMDKYPGKKRPFIVTSTHDWAQQKIAAEARSLPEAELERLVNEERGVLSASIDRLAGIEDTTCGINSQYIATVRAQTTELQNRIAQAETQRGRTTMAYSDAEREDVRQTLLGMNASSWDKAMHSDLSAALKEDRAGFEAQFETLLASYCNDNGKRLDKRGMKLACELFASFMATDGDKTLDGFHQYVDNSTRTAETFNYALWARQTGAYRA